jgi:hypothetical protein
MRCRVERAPIGWRARVSAKTGSEWGRTFSGPVVFREWPALALISLFDPLRHNTGYSDIPANTYSAGMRVRFAFGTSLAIDFEVY